MGSDAAAVGGRTVYLCGGINGLSDAECKDWREEAKAALGPAGFKILDPMRRDFRGRESTAVREICEGDKFDIKDSDILLVNVARPSWGTAMEMMFAVGQPHRKVIVGFNCPENPSPWLTYHCDKLFRTLAEALAQLTGGG